MPKAEGFFVGSRIRTTQPARTLAQCGACGLFKKCITPKMPVAGAGRKRVLFVGESPSKDADSNGVPFGDQSGKFLRQILRRLDFDLDVDGWQTNAIICRPHGGRHPSAAEVGFCRPNLTRAIKELKPDVIVPMGQAAVAAVVGGMQGREGVGEMAKWAGWRIPCQELNAWVCPTWPVSGLYTKARDHSDREIDPVMERQFTKHIASAVGMYGRPWPDGPPDWGQDVKRVLDTDRAARWLRNVSQRDVGAIAWDYETNMLKPDGPDALIVTCSVAWGREEPEQCMAFPWHGEAITAMGELLRSPIPKIASNMKFEDRWTRKEFGHRVRAWAWDTMLAAHVCDNRPGITSVKFQGYARLGVPVWNDKVEPFLKSKGDETMNAILREIDLNDLLLYNGLDSIIEFRVAVDQMRELGYPAPWKV